jgi:tRNA-2-methylthio-N6-dimethylallyladenosine synthase
MAGQLSKNVVQERYQRLVDLQEAISFEENQALVGSTVELLVASGEGRKDPATARMTGRARDGRLVHFSPGDLPVRPGAVVITALTVAAPHHLSADARPSAHRRTRAGDAHESGLRPRTIGLGLPAVGASERLMTTGCGQ